MILGVKGCEFISKKRTGIPSPLNALGLLDVRTFWLKALDVGILQKAQKQGRDENMQEHKKCARKHARTPP